MAAHETYRSLSYWHESVPDDLEPRPPLEGERFADVAIVGAGFTGLWTAYYLKKADPGIDVAIIEAETAGFGASGRNGGWCVGQVEGTERWLANPSTHEGAIALMRKIHDTVDEVGRVAETEEIQCDFAKGGTVSVATAGPHVRQLKRLVDSYRELGFDEDDYAWLEPDECRNRVNTATNLGGAHTPHCAALHPSKLARGLADVVERLGASIYERSPVRSIEDGIATTARGSVRASIVLRATEGYTPRLAGHTRKLISLHTMMIATEPLPESTWDEIGLGERETFGDGRRLTIYGQRTTDGRMAFGARGEYEFNSRIVDRFQPADPRFRSIHKTLLGLFPVLRDAKVTHRWGGALGVPRDWCPSVGVDRSRRLAWAGGYVGAGVAASNLAGRTVADLILERDSDLTRLPWVGTPFPDWEPEPLRWAGVKAITKLAESVDTAELRDGVTPKLRARLLSRFIH